MHIFLEIIWKSDDFDTAKYWIFTYEKILTSLPLSYFWLQKGLKVIFFLLVVFKLQEVMVVAFSAFFQILEIGAKAKV